MSHTTYSLKDVAEHATREEPWIIIHDKVYNVKNLLPKHPGGETVLLTHAGKDATKGFEDKGHSDKAKTWMKDFQIGSLGGAPKKWFQSCLYQTVAVAVGVVGIAAGIAAIIGMVIHESKNVDF